MQVTVEHYKKQETVETLGESSPVEVLRVEKVCGFSAYFCCTAYGNFYTKRLCRRLRFWNTSFPVENQFVTEVKTWLSYAEPFHYYFVHIIYQLLLNLRRYLQMNLPCTSEEEGRQLMNQHSSMAMSTKDRYVSVIKTL